MHDRDDLRAALETHEPFSSVSPEVRERVIASAEIAQYAAGTLVLDAFSDPSSAVYLILDGQVGLWNDARKRPLEPDEILGPGRVFGFSAMITERSVGPKAIALTQARVARLPGEHAAAAFVTRQGARFLADNLLPHHEDTLPTRATGYQRLGDLIVESPLQVPASASIAEVAKAMTDQGRTCAVVTLDDGFGLVTDASLRERVLVDGLPPTAPARDALDRTALHTPEDTSAAESLVGLIEADAEAIVVTTQDGRLAGVVTMREFALSPTAADLAVHQQLRRAPTSADLTRHAQEIPSLLRHLLRRGLGSGRVIAVYSSLIDAIIHRAIEIELAKRPDLPADGFTWYALGSNGRREAVLSSDVDSGVAFADGTSPELMSAYREVFAQVDVVLMDAGFTGDAHGVSARHEILSRTDSEWLAAARGWLADPVADKGAIMTSLLVDSRPITGAQRRVAAEFVASELRSHPGTMRLLLLDALDRRAKWRSMLEGWRGPVRYDLKDHAILPLVNLARWGALAVRSTALSTPDRLRACGGTSILPQAQANSLIEVFEVLQRLRLRYQLLQVADGARASDAVLIDQLSPIDRSVVAQAVREIATAQKRLANFSAYVDTDEWTRPAQG